MSEEPLLPDPTGLDVARQIADAISHQAPLPKPRRQEARGKRGGSAGPRRRASEMQTVGEALEEVISERGWTTQVSVHLLLGRWPELVGSAVAAHSRPESYERGVVLIRCDSTAWATQLRLMAPQLLARLNDSLGDGTITRLNIRGPDAPDWRKGPRTVGGGRGPRDTYG